MWEYSHEGKQLDHRHISLSELNYLSLTKYTGTSIFGLTYLLL